MEQESLVQSRPGQHSDGVVYVLFCERALDQSRDQVSVGLQKREYSACLTARVSFPSTTSISLWFIASP